ncbi:MAG: fibronectin type III domain-containing protein, partial [Bacteroidales bacterium]|nr:fibronectin type III domain-containing protein [Bacteroidales bacterium]
MKNTEKSAFEVNENNVVLSASDIVFNGSVSFPGDYGWVTINLTTPFTREAGKNLLIGVDKNSDQDLGTGYLFRFTTANNTCWYAYGSSDIDPTTSLSGTVSSARPNIKISFATTDLPYSVDFDVADDLAPWTIVDGATSTGWCEGEGYDNCFKFAYENGHETQYLISPELGNTATGVNVGFEYKGTNCTFQVGYSTTSNELSAFTWDEAITAPVLFAEFAKDYPADVHYIAIKYNAASSGQLYIDNVSLTVPLLTPTEFAASNITSNSATLTWTGTADSYNLQYKTTDGSWSDIINVTGTSHTLSSLDAATIYEAQLQAVYGEEASAWVSTTFETLPIAPSHLYVSNLKPDSATLNWTGVHPTYNLRYRTTTDIYENF